MRETKTYNDFLPAALAFAHRAFAAAAIFARAVAFNVRLTLRTGIVVLTLRPLTFAHRALAAAEILARAAALIRNFFLEGVGLLDAGMEPVIRPSFFSRDRILSFI